jgi:regulator of protease activity HflC (stomatin/prohibitin superfamily)
MRVDHQACQRAATTALTGLILQLLIATTLLVFGLFSDSTAFVFASLFAWVGILIWLGLIILFYQEKMKLLEELEESELVGDEHATMFESSGDEIRPAASRLKLIHRWVMPAFSLFTACSLIIVSSLVLRHMGRLHHQDDSLQTFLQHTKYIGWALAVSMAFALTSFIYSRFIAGMSRISVWTNLRGGSAWMVGNAVVLFALSVGLLFRFFDNEEVLLAVTWGIPIFMLAVAAEILINFILNLYRPRLHGESPRPAFDSKTLSLFASPDSLVRSINEAINYQFGFDITSSWGYQLFLRSVIWLIGLGVFVLFAMSTIVIVEPTQQAVRVRQGAIIGEVHNPGPMFKLPWPIEVSIVEDVTHIRTLPLSFTWKKDRPVILWTDDYNKHALVKPTPFIVNDSQGTTESISDDLLSLVDIRAVLQYRIAKDGLMDWLHFGSDEIHRRSRITYREMAILAISQDALTQMFQNLQLDEVLGTDRSKLSSIAKERLQASLDKQHSGIEVISVDLPLISPAGKSAQSFEELSVAKQGEARLISAATGHAQSLLTRTVGDPDFVDDTVQAVKRYNNSRDEWDEVRRNDASSAQSIATAKENMLQAESDAVALVEIGNGRAAAQIRSARVERWTTLMDTWAKSSRVRGQMEAYKSAPELYMQRMYMSVLARKLPNMRKYVTGIDPSRLSVDVELREINPLLNFADTLENNEEGAQ